VHSRNIQGIFREHSGYIQGTFSQHSPNTQSTFTAQGAQQYAYPRRKHLCIQEKCEEHMVIVPGAHSGKHSGNIQETFRKHSGRLIQGTFSDHSVIQWPDSVTIGLIH
jgi:hypothetical protein